MKIGHITQDRIEYYVTDVDNFEADIEAFYGCGITSFVTNKIVVGTETYYLHYLRFCIPKLVRHTWQTYQCGVKLILCLIQSHVTQIHIISHAHENVLVYLCFIIYIITYLIILSKVYLKHYIRVFNKNTI